MMDFLDAPVPYIVSSQFIDCYTLIRGKLWFIWIWDFHCIKACTGNLFTVSLLFESKFIELFIIYFNHRLLDFSVMYQI